jgi:hypothetical protein
MMYNDSSTRKRCNAEKKAAGTIAGQTQIPILSPLRYRSILQRVVWSRITREERKQ